LFRNLHGAISAEHVNNITAVELTAAIVEEMTVISSIVQEQTRGKLKVVYYACSYKHLTGLYKGARFKEVKTDKQKFYAALENNCLENVFRHFGKDNDIIHAYDTLITAKPKRVLLMTNYPIDLLNISGPTALGLLESHTGTVKTKLRWNTKLNGGNNLPRIPFDRMTVQVFGDSGGLFSPYPRDYRDKLVALAEKYKWTPDTTKGRILQCLELMREPTYEIALKKLYW